MPKTSGVLAWHFLREDGKLNYIDVEPPPDGETLVHSGEVELCSSGLHASKNLWDALSYAPGPVLCRVRMGGTVKNGDDKLVASERTILWRLDAPTMNRLLRLWGCWCVRNTKLNDGRTTWDLLTDPRSRHAVEVAERYANGDATREELGAAWAAARAAARASARSAARDAATKQLLKMVNDEHKRKLKEKHNA